MALHPPVSKQSPGPATPGSQIDAALADRFEGCWGDGRVTHGIPTAEAKEPGDSTGSQNTCISLVVSTPVSPFLPGVY